MPANGWWHEWTYNYETKVDNNEVHLDIAEREAKILVHRGENWEPTPPAPEPVAEAPSAEATPADQPQNASQEQQPDSSTNQKPEATQSETPSQ